MGGMKTPLITAVVSILLAAVSAARAELPIHRWDIETTSTRPVIREIVRGESIHLQPRFLNEGAAMDLTNVNEVAIRYRSADMNTNSYYIAYGSVYAATAGVVRITWTPTNEPPASLCQYTITATSAAGSIMRGFGILRFLGSIQGDAVNMATTVAGPFDWSLITEHLNTASAPFATTSTVSALDARVTGMETGKLDKADATYSNTVALAATAVQPATLSAYSTGTPIYAESDPVFTAASGSIVYATTPAYMQAVAQADGALQRSGGAISYLKVGAVGALDGEIELVDSDDEVHQQKLGSETAWRYPDQNQDCAAGYLSRRIYRNDGDTFICKYRLYDSGNFLPGTDYLDPLSLSAYVPRIETNGWEVGSHTGLAVASVVVTQVWSVAQYPLALTNAAAFDAAGTAAALSNVLGSAAFTAATNYAELATNNTFAEGTTNIFDVIQTQHKWRSDWNGTTMGRIHAGWVRNLKYQHRVRICWRIAARRHGAYRSAVSARHRGWQLAASVRARNIWNRDDRKRVQLLAGDLRNAGIQSVHVGVKCAYRVNAGGAFAK